MNDAKQRKSLKAGDRQLLGRCGEEILFRRKASSHEVQSKGSCWIPDAVGHGLHCFMQWFPAGGPDALTGTVVTINSLVFYFGTLDQWKPSDQRMEKGSPLLVLQGTKRSGTNNSSGSQAVVRDPLEGPSQKPLPDQSRSQLKQSMLRSGTETPP